MQLPDYPVFACYARIIDDGLKDVQVENVSEELRLLDISALDKSGHTVGSIRSMAPEDAVRKTVRIF